jgi:hypothetical protein
MGTFAEQPMPITVYHLPTKENKLLFSVCRKQMEVCCFRFLFAVKQMEVAVSG